MKRICLVSLLLMLTGCASVWADETGPVPEFDPGLSGFNIHIKQKIIPYAEFSVFVLPGETLRIEIAGVGNPYAFTFTAPDGDKTHLSTDLAIWQAPSEPGVYPVRIRDEASLKETVLNVLVMVPFAALKRGFLNGYQIGHYPPDGDQEIYQPPVGFMEVTPQNENTALSPHFRIKQFLSKQTSGYPKYLVLKEQLLLKLELLLQMANARGFTCSSFVIMSGFRTPFYNKSIGNVKFSRHLWGDAADIYIDENPRDGVMDDLNRDGISNQLDAEVLYNLIDSLQAAPGNESIAGGLAHYPKNRYHGPYVHVDVRGIKARWGQ